MTFQQAKDSHLQNLAALGWAVKPGLKVPHATRPDGLRLWFKAQAVYASRGTTFGDTRSIFADTRTTPTATLVQEAEHFTT